MTSPYVQRHASLRTARNIGSAQQLLTQMWERMLDWEHTMAVDPLALQALSDQASRLVELAVEINHTVSTVAQERGHVAEVAEGMQTLQDRCTKLAGTPGVTGDRT